MNCTWNKKRVFFPSTYRKFTFDKENYWVIDTVSNKENIFSCELSLLDFKYQGECKYENNFFYLKNNGRFEKCFNFNEGSLPHPHFETTFGEFDLVFTNKNNYYYLLKSSISIRDIGGYYRDYSIWILNKEQGFIYFAYYDIGGYITKSIGEEGLINEKLINRIGKLIN